VNAVAKTTDPSALSEHVVAQVGPQARAYLHNDVHAHGAEFAELRADLADH
jgi:hypothetical protein